jgi:hypothetical protein
LRDKISIIKNYHDKKWTLQFLDALYNNIDITTPQIGFYSGYFPQLAAVVQPLLLGVLQSLTAVLLKTAVNWLQRLLKLFESSPRYLIARKLNIELGMGPFS